MGAYICTISERDWDIARTRGVYGNRYKKEGTNRVLRDVQQLSIIRDLISIREGDFIFFHIRKKKTIHGVYRARSESFWDETEIWDDPYDVFPYRFLFEPHPLHEKLCLYDANISVHSLYELIDQGEIKSLVTLEFEKNIEARAVKRIFEEDARKIIRLLYRDFKQRRRKEKVEFDLYKPSKKISLKEKIYGVGRLENAIKAVLSWMLAHRDERVVTLLGGKYDFVNEFFIAPTTRKNIDFFCQGNGLYAVLETKKDKCNRDTLRQALYYADLLDQRAWIRRDFKKFVILIGKGFAEDVKRLASTVNKVGNNEVVLMEYQPLNNGKWAKIEVLKHV